MVDVFMWPKFGNSNISMKDVTITSLSKRFDQENYFSWGVVLVQVQECWTGTR